MVIAMPILASQVYQPFPLATELNFGFIPRMFDHP